MNPGRGDSPGHDISAQRSIADLPGPPRLWLLGNAHQIGSPSGIHVKLEEWSRRYGPIIRLNIGPRPVVAISDADAINAVLRERPDTFRRWSDQKEVIGEIGPNAGVFVAEGDDWKRQRRLVAAALSSNHLHRYFHVIDTATRRLRLRLCQAASDGRALEITRELSSYTVDITSALAFGHDLNTLEQGENRLQAHVERIGQMVARRIVLPIRYWRWLKLPADRALERSVAELHEAVEEFVAQARERMARRPELNEAPENMLEAMLAAQLKDETFTDEEIEANVSVFLLAGENTTAHTLAWTIWLIASRPDIQRRLAEEAREALGDDLSPTDYKTVETLKYAEAVIRESVRLKTVGPMLMLEPIVDTTICDTRIPAGTRLLLLLRQAGLKVGERTDEFDPERWLNDADTRGAQTSLAFGGGPRFCPGRNLAFVESKAAIAMIARNFAIELDESQRPVREALHFTMVPKGLVVRLRERVAEQSAPVGAGVL